MSTKSFPHESRKKINRNSVVSGPRLGCPRPVVLHYRAEPRRRVPHDHWLHRPGGSVRIPYVVNGLPIYDVGAGAFANNSSLTNITLPEEIFSIGQGGFSNCTSLAAISAYPGGPTNIGADAFFGTALTTPYLAVTMGAGAFADCSNLTSIDIGGGLYNLYITIVAGLFSNCPALKTVSIASPVTNIAPGSFANCSNLQSISASGSYFSSSGGVLFNANKTVLLEYPNGLAAGQGEAFYTVPSTVTNIAAGAFLNCAALDGITIPSSVTTIGDNAFAGCFQTATGISLSIPASTTNIGANVFLDCFGLGTITVNTLNPAYCSVSGVLYDKNTNNLLECPCSLRSLTIPASVTNIAANAFEVSDTGSLTIPTNVTHIAVGAFGYCPDLTGMTVALPNSFFTSVSGVLFNANKSTLLYYPSGKTGAYIIPAGASNISAYAFQSCLTLTNLTFPAGLTNISANAFYACSNLVRIALPSTVTNIAPYAFGNCIGLTNVSLTTNLAAIGNDAFAGCSSLLSVAIPRSVTNVGNLSLIHISEPTRQA